MYQFFIGIDISKNDFSVAVIDENKAQTFQNSLKGFNDFFVTYKNKLLNGLCVLETTGGYEMDLIYFLQSRDCAVHRAHARTIKYFIRSLGHNAKTDNLDALGLARYAQERHATLSIYEANPHEKLVKLVQRRIELKQMLVQEKNRRQSPQQHDLKKSFDAIIHVLEKQMKEINEKIQEFCKTIYNLSEKIKVLKSINGIGDIIAVELLALLPELGSINRKKIASLGGVAPHPNDSGNKKGYRSTRGGRAGIKPMLFMAAMTASRSKSVLGDFYHHLLKAGKKKMVALTALMRKILVIANAKLRDFLTLNEISQHG